MKLIPIHLLEYVFPATCGRVWRKRACRGDLGPLHCEGPRRRFAHRAELEARYGAVSDQRLQMAIADYQRKHGIARRILTEGAANA